MRWLALVAIACGSRAPSGPRLQIVYELDTDAAIDDALASFRTEIEAKIADDKIDGGVRVTPTGLEVTGSRAGELDAFIGDLYRDQLVHGDCAHCYAIANSFDATIRKAALTAAVDTVRERLDGFAGASVSERDGHIVVEVPATDANAKRPWIARAGKLELVVADDGSPFMQRLASRAATDSRVEVEVDQWRGEDGSSHTDSYLVAHDRAAIERFVADLAVSDPSFRIPDDRRLGYEHRADTWRSYYLERAVALTGASVADAKPESDPITGRPTVSLTFNRAGTRILADLTTRITGHKLAIMLDGQITSAPVITGPITGGRASIAMGAGSAAEAERDDLVRVLKTGSLPAPLHEISSTTLP